MAQTKFFKFISLATLLSLVLAPYFFVAKVEAAALTAMSDTMSREKANTASSNVIKFTTPSAINTNGNTIVVAFPTDFNFTGAVITDVTFTHGASTGAENTETLAASPSTTAWGAVFTDGNCAASRKCTLTLTAPTDGVGAASVAASDKIILTYASTHEVNPSTTGTFAITITTPTDSGSIGIPIVGGTASDENVVVTATVNPTITFTNDDATVGFGTLTTANARYATGDTLGSGADSVAHTMVIATNAPSGYTLTYNGPTLTAGTTIPAATITSDADGTPGSSQFALDTALTGSGTVASGYNHANPDWKFVASTTTTLGSHTAAVSGDSYAMHYIANISASQAPGSYSTTITYIATGNF